jgi:hypothetical protein
MLLSLPSSLLSIILIGAANSGGFVSGAPICGNNCGYTDNYPVLATISFSLDHCSADNSENL